MKSFASFLVAFVISAMLIGVGIWRVFGPVSQSTEETVFVVPQQTQDFDVAAVLASTGLIRNQTAFRYLLMVMAPGSSVVSGGYRLRPSMSAWVIADKLTDAPQFVWVSVREGLRKEQIGELLAAKLGWSSKEEQEWNDYNKDSIEYREGVYFPDTYLVARDEPVAAVAKRFLDRFNEKIAPLLDQFTAADIKWTTAIKIASLIERESGVDSDKALIAGIIWNRLEKDMRLEIDATLQYIKGNSEEGWWSRVVPGDKYLRSPYNTYRNAGLPPGPISNPGLASIEAVLRAEDTDCIFYLHSSDKEIHCATTYDKHLENIRVYLQ